ncbi:MAG: SRPBCC family protein [Bdellovibrionales bacterium]|nr:SRPBCC family protein [Bdellovibrionales bacterium]
MQHVFSWFRKSLVLAFALLFVTLIVAAILPASYELESSIEIQGDIQTIYDSIADFETWEHWSPWVEKEPTAQWIYQGSPKTLRSRMSWRGEILGQGSMTLVETNPPKKLRVLVEIEKPWVSRMLGEFYFRNVAPSRVEVQWINEGDLSYPIERVLGYWIRQQIQKDFEKALQNLKTLHEGTSK